MPRTLPPAKGTCRWLEVPEGATYMLLEIATEGNEPQVYEVVRASHEGGWLLLRANRGNITRYHVRCVRRGVWECDCPDATNRPERRYACKHSRALAKALKSLPF